MMIFCDRTFTTFLSMAQGGSAHVMDFVNIPISIVLGVLLGAVVGYALYLFLKRHMRENTACATV